MIARRGAKVFLQTNSYYLSQRTYGYLEAVATPQQVYINHESQQILNFTSILNAFSLVGEHVYNAGDCHR